MTAKSMMPYVEGNSAIRAMFEEGARLAEKYGKENVYDFSLGNPNVPAPKEVNEAIKAIVDEEESTFLHGYTSNPGYEDVRKAVADNLNKRFGTHFTFENIIMTVGAAGGLNVIFKSLLNVGDEVIAFAPYFGEYRSYVANYDGRLVEVAPDKSTFMPDMEAFEAAITPKTKAVIVNNPNNPSGVVYSEAAIKEISAIMDRKQKEYSSEIYLIADEPYRELVYDGAEVPFLTKYYDNTIVGYSFSKSLSLPGERIGYLVIPSELDDYEDVWGGACVANRILGFVNAPSLQQLFLAECLDESTDISYYERNRNTLYDGLTKIGYECPSPEGAFYLFMKTPIEDKEFCEKAKKYNILVVPGSAFACPGYCRIAYCVSYETICNSLPKFEELYKEIKG